LSWGEEEEENWKKFEEISISDWNSFGGSCDFEGELREDWV